MKATLSFKIPAEQEGLNLALSAIELKLALSEVWQEYRRLSKYSDLSEFKEKTDLLDHLKEKYLSILSDHEISSY